MKGLELSETVFVIVSHQSEPCSTGKNKWPFKTNPKYQTSRDPYPLKLLFDAEAGKQPGIVELSGWDSSDILCRGGKANRNLGARLAG